MAGETCRSTIELRCMAHAVLQASAAAISKNSIWSASYVHTSPFLESASAVQQTVHPSTIDRRDGQCGVSGGGQRRSAYRGDDDRGGASRGLHGVEGAVTVVVADEPAAMTPQRL